MAEAVGSHEHDTIKEYYSKIIKTKDDLKTSACCASDAMPRRLRDIVKQIEPEVIEKFYGCGSPIPQDIDGCTVLDLGCGTGRDVFIASKLVGETGSVIGVDMTDEQLEVARRHTPAQMKRFGFERANVTFLKGYIEDLAAAGVADESVDVVISNCVLNLSPDKPRVFSEIFRVLKPGGELYFSDIFADRRIPEAVAKDPVLRGECLGGAMYIEDFRRLLHSLGCPDYRVVVSRKTTVREPSLRAAVGPINFSSKTIRAFKLADLEDICEDYGQVATYQGTMAECPTHFTLDNHHDFFAKKPMLVCGNTAAMVSESRFGRHFEVAGTRNTHFGAFDCGPGSCTEESTDGACC
ncbi:MAG: methyltransferase domain-containing protein [Planctomycetes bacterium]|nr:methyltransferase domain-containing protein [Planctomycetota bacterium]